MILVPLWDIALNVVCRAKHIKESPRVNFSEEKCDTSSSAASPSRDESSARILNKVRILL